LHLVFEQLSDCQICKKYAVVLVISLVSVRYLLFR